MNSTVTVLTPCKQYFSLPYTLITNIYTNPSSIKGLLKLYQTCKYFYSKQKLVFLKDATCTDGIFEQTPHMNPPDVKTLYCINKNFSCCGLFSIAALNKQYFFNISYMGLIGVNLLFSDFQVLVSENRVQRLYFWYSTISYSNGSNVPIDIVLENVRNSVHNFIYFNENEKYSFETLENLKSVKLRHKLKYIELLLKNIADNFCPESLCEFLIENTAADCCIFFNLEDRNIMNELKLCYNHMIDQWDGEIPQLHFSINSF